MAFNVGMLALPVSFVGAIEAGKWKPPINPEWYFGIFGEGPELPEFYDLAAINRQNRSWQALSVEDAFGSVNDGHAIGIDPALSVVIGDLGPDMPIVLDYRLSLERPRVLYLRLSGASPVWVVIADTIDSLVEMLPQP